MESRTAGRVRYPQAPNEIPLFRWGSRKGRGPRSKVGRAAVVLVVVLCSWILMLALGRQDAMAQVRAARIWDIVLGTEVTDLPEDFMLLACGTNGGPPSTVLHSFADFARCRAEATGLREVWFGYDDEVEYIQRAFRASPDVLGRYLANNLFGHPVIYSVLIDAGGRVQGYRIISDPREDPETRVDATVVAPPLKTNVYGLEGWNCVDLPPRDGEMPFGRRFEKQSCWKISDGRYITLETHFYLKAGQRVATPAPGEFEARMRLEVISADLVR